MNLAALIHENQKRTETLSLFGREKHNPYRLVENQLLEICKVSAEKIGGGFRLVEERGFDHTRANQSILFQDDSWQDLAIGICFESSHFQDLKFGYWTLRGGSYDPFQSSLCHQMYDYCGYYFGKFSFGKPGALCLLSKSFEAPWERWDEPVFLDILLSRPESGQLGLFGATWSDHLKMLHAIAQVSLSGE